MATTTACRWRMLVSLAVALSAVSMPIGDRWSAGWIAGAHAQDELPSDTNEAANVLFVRALQAIAEADTAGTVAARLALLQQAQTDLDRIVRDYPEADLAVQIISQQRIGAFYPGELGDRISAAEIAVEEEYFCRDHPDPCVFLADAMATVRLIPEDSHTSVQALGDVIAAQAMVGLTVAAEHAFADAARRALEIADNQERQRWLATISMAQAAAGMISGAQTTAAGIKDDGYHSTALRHIASALARADRMAEARTAIDAAVATILNAPYSDTSRIEMLAGIALDLAIAGSNELARETLARLFEADLLPPAADAALYEVYPRAFTRVASALAAIGSMDEARQTSADAVAAAYQFDPNGGIPGFFAIVGQAENGFYDDALAAAAVFRGEDAYGNILTTVATHQAGSGEADRALATVSTISDDFVRTEALWYVAGALADAGLVAAALQTAADAEAMSNANGYRWTWTGVQALTDVELAVAAAASAEEADRILANAEDRVAAHREELRQDTARSTYGIEDDQYLARALADIAAARATAGSTASARRTFAAATAAARDIDSESLRADTLADIADVQAQVAVSMLEIQ